MLLVIINFRIMILNLSVITITIVILIVNSIFLKFYKLLSA